MSSFIEAVCYMAGGVYLAFCYYMFSISEPFCFYLPGGMGSCYRIHKEAKTKFSDVIGMHHIKKDLQHIIKKRTSKGIIFVGEPGTGKTLMARAIAGECNSEFIQLKSHNSYLYRLETVMKTILKHHPNCVIYLDEASSTLSKNIDDILQILDGFESKNVLFIASMNDFSTSKALTRSGRMETIINFTCPPESDRLEHLKILFPSLENKELSEINNTLDNFTHADLVSISKHVDLEENKSVKEAILNVIYKMKTIKDSNDEIGIRENKVQNKHLLRTTYHEIGHLIMFYLLTMEKPVSITIQKRKVEQVKTLTGPLLGKGEIYGQVEQKQELQVLTEIDFYHQIVMFLASSVFEEYYLGGYSNLCEHDFLQIDAKFKELERCKFIPKYKKKDKIFR